MLLVLELTIGRVFFQSRVSQVCFKHLVLQNLLHVLFYFQHPVLVRLLEKLQVAFVHRFCLVRLLGVVVPESGALRLAEAWQTPLLSQDRLLPPLTSELGLVLLYHAIELVV